MSRRQVVFVGWAVIVANLVAVMVNVRAGAWYLAPVSFIGVAIGAATLRRRVPMTKQWWER